jgi:uncharacterized membrane protein YccC
MRMDGIRSVVQFAVGLVIAIVAAALVFFVRMEKLGFWPMVAAIFGISLIATSETRFLSC